MRLEVLVLAAALYLFSCKNTRTDLGKPSDLTNNKPGKSDRQLNINVLWDLSDRIDSVKNPSSPQQYEKDIAAIRVITELFKKEMERQGAYKAKGKLRLFFTPTPRNQSINNIAQNLVCDLSSLGGEGANKRKKAEYDSIQHRFERSMTLIYKLAVENHEQDRKWEGADLWRFFKNDVKATCIEQDTSYRNILVILTDGYIYHQDSKSSDKNRTTFILPETLKVFRNNGQWRQLFDKEDYGLIATRNDLQSLEILVLEINPSTANKGDEDIIRAYLSKWFEEMGIKEGNYSFHNSDLPIHTKGKIEKFFN